MSEHDRLNEKALDATEKFKDRRAIIFIQEAIANYIDRFGIKETRRHLHYMLDFLEEFESD